MQAKIKTEPYEYFDPVFDGTYEAPIDTEYNLPDYCADIQKILKCCVSTEISSYVISDDTLTCDGVCDIRVLYLDAKGDSIKCCSFTKDFSASIPLKSSQEQAVAYIQAEASRMTCRAVSARRIDIHGAVTLKVLAVVQKRELITSDIEAGDIEKKGSNIKAHRAVNAMCHQFTVEEQISLKNGKPPIESILRKDICCRINDKRLSDGSITVNGRADVSFLYLSALDGTTVEKMTASIDFSRMIDCPSADDNCLCDLRVITGENSVQPKEDDVGEYTGVNVMIKVFLIAFLYKPCEVDIIDDAYSINAPLELRYTQGSFMQIQDLFSETLKKKCSITVSEGEIQKIIDIWCEQNSVQTVCEKGKLNYRVRYTVCMLYMTMQGRLTFTERQFDHNFVTELSNDLARKSETVSCTDIWEYRISDRNTVEISTETAVVSLLFSRSSVKHLASLSADENAEGFEKASRLLVYYGCAGESLWDIAKSHRALLSDIRSQNDIYDDTLTDDRPIIICNR